MVNKKGILVLFSGPSGVGKDTVLDVVLKKDTGLQKSISLTTREKRESEVEGKDYYFISRSEFDNLVEEGQVLEFAQYGSNFYGTPKAPVDKWLSEGKIVILKIEVQGAAKIKELYPDSVAIFLLPPSMNELEKRLRSRGTENEDCIYRCSCSWRFLCLDSGYAESKAYQHRSGNIGQQMFEHDLPPL